MISLCAAFIIETSEGDLEAKGGDDVGGDVGVREPLPPLLLSSVCLDDIVGEPELSPPFICPLIGSLTIACLWSGTCADFNDWGP